LATALNYAPEITIESPREDAVIRGLSRYFFMSFWLVVFTGAIRKWVMPHVNVLYLLQDVPMAMGYFYALRMGIFDRGYMSLGLVLLSAILVLQGLMQMVVSGLSLFVAGVGMHNYLFYLFMLLVFPLCLTEKNRRTFVRWNLLFSIPMCALAIAQAESPLNAWVNHTSEGDAFGVPGAENVARVSGTFNFTFFYGIWVSIAVALCMGEWLLPKERRVLRSQWLLILCTFTVNICHLVSASRQAIMLAGMAILGGLVGALVLRSYRAIAVILGILFMLPVTAGLTYLISPLEANIVWERFTGSHYVEDGRSRVAGSAFGFLSEPSFSLVGAGIGLGVDASHVGNAETYNFTYQLSEVDTTRTVMELGTPVGLFYVFVRLTFITGMIFAAIRIVRAGSCPHVLPLAFCLFAEAFLGDLTRAATMTASQVMLGYCFILGALYYPDQAALPADAIESSSLRYA
jgi:hypothetical protein